MTKLFFSTMVLFALLSCGGGGERTDGYSDNPRSQEDSLFKDVLEGHDVAMAKMGKLKGFRKEVEARLDSLAKLSPPSGTRIDTALSNLRRELENAEQQMNVWMEDFVIDSASDNLERRIDYLLNEKIRVDKVRDDIMRALERADSVLRKSH